jgi:hypothetical protein
MTFIVALSCSQIQASQAATLIELQHLFVIGRIFTCWEWKTGHGFQAGQNAEKVQGK